MDEDLWSVEYDVVGFEGIQRAFTSFLELNRDNLERGVVDAITDDKSLPREVESARRTLVEIGKEARAREGRLQRAGARQMRIELNLQHPRHVELFETFGAYSIDANAYFQGAANDADYCLNVHDSGSSLLLRLNDPVTFRAAADLPEEGLVDLGTAQGKGRDQRKKR